MFSRISRIISTVVSLFNFRFKLFFELQIKIRYCFLSNFSTVDLFSVFSTTTANKYGPYCMYFWHIVHMGLILGYSASLLIKLLQHTDTIHPDYKTEPISHHDTLNTESIFRLILLIRDPWGTVTATAPVSIIEDFSLQRENSRGIYSKLHIHVALLSHAPAPCLISIDCLNQNPLVLCVWDAPHNWHQWLLVPVTDDLALVKSAPATQGWLKSCWAN